MSTAKRYICTAAFLVLAVAFFFMRGWFVAVPTLFAAVVAATASRTGGVAIPLALLCSSAGDYAGSTGNFLMQVAFFAVAHICYICDFAPRRASDRGRMVGATALAVVALGYLGLVLSHIASQAEFVAVAIYGLIIYIMGATAIFQHRKHYAWYVVAAVLFILSDSLIVCGKYITTLPHGSEWVMITYYAAQGLFLTLHLSRRQSEE
ncbi:MAG: lysoplasmalogenase [Alistipes sp.]|nr:lysoplasmalogenase [Alistipes sp.]